MQGSIQERIRAKGKNSQGRVRSNIKVYDVRYRYKDPQTGKIKSTVKRGFLTKGEAEAFLLELNNQLAQNTFASPKTTTVREYLLDWFETYVKTNLRRSTCVGYERIIKNHLIPHIGNQTLKELTAMQIDRLYAHLSKAGRADGKGGLSAKTVMYTHRVLNEAMSHAVKKQLLFRNPVQCITNVPKPKRFKGNIYTAEEILHLLAVLQDTPYEMAVALAAVCGLRRGECLALTEEDVDFENRTIRINKQLVDIDNKGVVWEPKSEDSNRIISAPQEIFDMIARHIARHAENKRLLVDEYHENGLIVCQDDGKAIRPNYFTNNFSNLIARHKLKPIRFHDLRHSCASLMLRSGVAMKTASQILGHSTIAITADLYTHVLEDSKRQAADQVGAILFGKNEKEASSNR